MLSLITRERQGGLDFCYVQNNLQVKGSHKITVYLDENYTNDVITNQNKTSMVETDLRLRLSIDRGMGSTKLAKWTVHLSSNSFESFQIYRTSFNEKALRKEHVK